MPTSVITLTASSDGCIYYTAQCMSVCMYAGMHVCIYLQLVSSSAAKLHCGIWRWLWRGMGSGAGSSIKSILSDSELFQPVSISAGWLSKDDLNQCTMLRSRGPSQMTRLPCSQACQSWAHHCCSYNFRLCRGMATSIRTPALGHSQNTEFRLCRARGCVRLQHPWTSPSRSSSSSGLWALTGWEAPQVTPGILFEVVSLQCGYRPSLPHAIPMVHFNAILKAQGHWSAAWTIGPSWAARRHVFSLFLWKASPFCYRHYLISLWPL